MFKKALEIVFVFCHSPCPLVSSLAIFSKLGFFLSCSYLVQSSPCPSLNNWEMALSLKGTYLPLM